MTSHHSSLVPLFIHAITDSVILNRKVRGNHRRPDEILPSSFPRLVLNETMTGTVSFWVLGFSWLWWCLVFCLGSILRHLLSLIFPAELTFRATLGGPWWHLVHGLTPHCSQRFPMAPPLLLLQDNESVNGWGLFFAWFVFGALLAAVIVTVS